MSDSDQRLHCVSPIDGSVYAERALARDAEVDAALARAVEAQRAWRDVDVAVRRALLSRALEAFLTDGDTLADELTWQMGRPRSQSPGELRGFEERARHMLAIGPEALADEALPEKAGLRRFLRRVPLGVVALLAPWNYPYLTAVNALVPALLAGNAVVLKHSSQTPLCAERLSAAFADSALPPGLLQHLHLSHRATLGLVADARVAHVAFTGSVDGGRAVQGAMRERFASVGLELGGKDPALRPAGRGSRFRRSKTWSTASFFNSGQSCCGIERIYVHGDVYDRLRRRVRRRGDRAGYRLGDPDGTPRRRSVPCVRVSRRPTSCASRTPRPRSRPVRAPLDGIRRSSRRRASGGRQYLGAAGPRGRRSSTCDVMSEESFGPIAGIVRVRSDEEAIERMNDSDYGLTACVFTRDEEAAIRIGDRVETGTWFQNRCDYLDPGLAWTGVKDSGRGVTLSRLGYDALTRPKSFHLRRT